MPSSHGITTEIAARSADTRAAGAAVVRIGASHATRYGLRRELPGLGASEVPLFRIDASGRAISVGRLVFMAGEESAWLPAGAVFDGLPPEIADMRPSGFIGRGFSRRFPELPVPERVDDWSDHHTVIALARGGEDLPGNLVLGDESIARWFEHAPPAAERGEVVQPELLDAAGVVAAERAWQRVQDALLPVPRPCGLAMRVVGFVAGHRRSIAGKKRGARRPLQCCSVANDQKRCS